MRDTLTGGSGKRFGLSITQNSPALGGMTSGFRCGGGNQLVLLNTVVTIRISQAWISLAIHPLNSTQFT